MSASPTLTDMLQSALSNHTSRLRVALPGRIESFDAVRNRASVTVLIKDSDYDETGTRFATALPIINDVPVVLPGSGKTRIRFPILAGDTCLLLFASSSLDLWLQRGDLVDAGDDRHHDENDAICIPGLSSFNRAQDDDVSIEFTSAFIYAGGTSALAKASEVSTLVNEIITKAAALPPASLEVGLKALGISLAALVSSGAFTGTTVLKGS